MVPTTTDSPNPFASESALSSSNMGSINGSIFEMSRAPSYGTEASSFIFEHSSSSSEGDGFSVYSGEDINVIYSDPFADDDDVDVLKSPSSSSAGVNLRQRRSSSGSRRSSMGSTASSMLEDDDEAGYEADSDGYTAARRARASTRRATSRRARATVHYLVERVEPTIEVLTPITVEELVYLKAHTNIPIPPHYEAMLLEHENAGEASEIGPSSASPSRSPSETPLDRTECAVEHAEPGTTLLSQCFVAELDHQPQRDLGHGDGPHWPACPVSLADASELIAAKEAVAVPSAAILGFEVCGALPRTPDYLTSDHIHPMYLQDLPPTPDLRPWLAVASGEPSPMLLASPTVPLVVHAPRPRLTRMATRR